jgi:hypothetical protein
MYYCLNYARDAKTAISPTNVSEHFIAWGADIKLKWYSVICFYERTHGNPCT